MQSFPADPRWWTRVEKGDLLNEICEFSRYQPQAVVYFLICKGTVVYVGQTTQLESRIASHSKNKDFDEVRFVVVPDWHIDEIEALAIQRLQPFYNVDYRQ